MAHNERRQHVRVDDKIYFDYCIFQADDCGSISNNQPNLLGEIEEKYLETLHYFQTIDYEFNQLSKNLQEPALNSCLNLINAKIEYLSRQMLIPSTLKQQKVNLSLGGLAFKTRKGIAEKSLLKVLIYTKPKLIPIFIDASVVYNQYQGESHYRTAISFNELTNEQEHLLSQHILLAQVQCPIEGF